MILANYDLERKRNNWGERKRETAGWREGVTVTVSERERCTDNNDWGGCSRDNGSFLEN